MYMCVCVRVSGCVCINIYHNISSINIKINDDSYIDKALPDATFL